MSASPLAFLRGSAPLFYEMLAADPDLASGPAGEGVIQGDAHLENFGAFSSPWRKRAPGARGTPPSTSIASLKTALQPDGRPALRA